VPALGINHCLTPITHLLHESAELFVWNSIPAAMTASRNRVRLGLCGTISEGSEEDLAWNSAGKYPF